MLLSPGVQFNRYQIIEPIGSGGLAQSYLALDAELQRKVAIKIAFDELGGFSDTILRKEAHTLAQLSHPSILSVFDAGEDHGHYYLVTEYLETSLSTELQRTTRLAHERTSRLIAEVANAADYLHRRGFLHRNIKPTIILLDSTGTPRLAGFDLTVQKEELLLTGDIAGTPSFMAPEQFSGAMEKMGAHTDVWGLGVTLYQLITGELPFAGLKIAEIANTITTQEPVPPRQIDPSIPPELERICLKCLTKSTDGRYATADKLAEDLLGWQRTNSIRENQRVFVSHSTRDRDFVEREIISLLEGHGIKTWYSKVSIQTAAEWERSIVAGLESCEWFLLAISPNAVLSDWVKDELYWAITKRPQRIIPVLIEPCDPGQLHIRLERLQNVDFTRDPEIARTKLVKAFEEQGS